MDKLKCIKRFNLFIIEGAEYEYKPLYRSPKERTFEIIIPNKFSMYFLDSTNVSFGKYCVYDYFNLKQVERCQRIKEILNELDIK